MDGLILVGAQPKQRSQCENFNLERVRENEDEIQKSETQILGFTQIEAECPLARPAIRCPWPELFVSTGFSTPSVVRFLYAHTKERSATLVGIPNSRARIAANVFAAQPFAAILALEFGIIETDCGRGTTHQASRRGRRRDEPVQACTLRCKHELLETTS